MDKGIRVIAENKQIRAFSIISTDMVNEAQRIHKMAPEPLIALGKLLTGASMLAMGLKNEKESIYIKIDGGGEIGYVEADGFYGGDVRGAVGNKNAVSKALTEGKLDINGIVGKDGDIEVVRNSGLKVGHTSKCELISGGIGQDLAWYLNKSEQRHSAISVGVLLDKDGYARSAGGYFIEALPDADEEVLKKIEKKVSILPPISELIALGDTAEVILDLLLEDMTITDEYVPGYSCRCSREVMEKALISIGASQLKELSQKKQIKMDCPYCDRIETFTGEDIAKLIKE